MKTAIILLFALLGFSPSSAAQPSFSQIDTSIYAYVFGGLIIDDKYHLPVIHNAINGLSTYGYLIKDEFGNTISRDTTFASPDKVGSPFTYRVNDSRYIEVIRIEPNSLFGNNYLTYIMNFDRSNANSTSHLFEGQYLRNRFLAGYYEVDSSLFHLISYGTTMSVLKDVFWKKFDLNGNLISTVVLAEQLFFEPQSIVSTPDGNYFISYMIYTYGNTYRDSGYMKITSDGEVIWEKEEVEFGNGNDFNAIFELADNTFLRFRKTAAGFICKKIDLNGRVLRNVQLPQDLYAFAGKTFYPDYSRL